MALFFLLSSFNLKILEDSWDVVDDSKVEDCENFGFCSVTCGGGEQECTNRCDNGETHFGSPGCPLARGTRRRSGCFSHDCRKGMTHRPEDFSTLLLY